MFIEVLIVIVIAAFAVLYYMKTGDSFYKFIVDTGSDIYDKYAPFTFKAIRQKVKDMGQDYTPRQYMIQIAIFAGGAFGITYLYFYNIITSIIYSIIAVCAIPYVTYLRSKRIYSEFIFEQIQVYTTNTIMEFQTTQNFVKAAEGVANSGLLESPVKDDVRTMIDMAYKDGSIDNALAYMNSKYDFHMTRNMHQLFLQVTREGARDTNDVLENMLTDIDVLVEGVYKDRMDRKNFHGQFIQFGLLLYGMVALIQLLLGAERYAELLNSPVVLVALHFIILFNSYFLLNGEKYYNENVGAE